MASPPRWRSLAEPRLSSPCAPTGIGMGPPLCVGLQAPAIRRVTISVRTTEAGKSLSIMLKSVNLVGFVGEVQEVSPLGIYGTLVHEVAARVSVEAWPSAHACCRRTVRAAIHHSAWHAPTPDALQAVYAAPPAAMATLLCLSCNTGSVSYAGGLTMLDMFNDADRDPKETSTLAVAFSKARATRMSMTPC